MSVKTPVGKGDHGLSVARVQTVLVKMSLLSEKAPSGKSSVNGQFDETTETAVKRFQRHVALPETGVVDFLTLKAMIPYRTIRVTGTFSDMNPPSSARLRLLPDLATTPPPDLNLHSRPTMPSVPARDLMRMRTGTTPVNTPSDPDTVMQFQATRQYVGKALWYSKPPGSTVPGQSLTLRQFQLMGTFGTRQDGMHFELGVGPSASANWKFKHDDPRFTFAGNVSLTLADVFSKGSFHVLSPNMQFSLYDNTDAGMHSVSTGVGVQLGNQMSVDFIKSVFSLQLTPALYISCDFKTGQCALAPGVSGGLQWVF